MQDRKQAIKMLQPVCPACRGLLSGEPVDEGIMHCQTCGKGFPIHGSIVDFRTKTDNPTTGWNVDAFEQNYAELDCFEDNFQHASRDGLPHFIEQYRISRVKDCISHWLSEHDRPDAEILDIGCGHGWYALQLYEQWDIRGKIAGIDISLMKLRDFAKQAARRLPKHQIAVYCANAEAIPFPDNSFDLAYCTEVLEHVENPAMVFEELGRVLKPGGQVYISTPSGPACRFWDAVFWLPRKLKRLLTGKSRVMKTPPAYDHPLSRRQITAMISDADLKLIYYRKAIFLPHESYVGFFPNWIKRVMLAKAVVLEKLEPLSTPLGLHQLIIIEKI